MLGDIFAVITPCRKCTESGPEMDTSRLEGRDAYPADGGHGGFWVVAEVEAKRDELRMEVWLRPRIDRNRQDWQM